MLTGENGILTQANEAKEKTEEAQEQENMTLGNYESIIEEITNGTINANVISNSEDKNEYYGKIITNYDCANSEGVKNWKIFYADENNIYLIADDYIYKDYCPSPSSQNLIQDNGNGYKLSMNNVINEYKGSEDITNLKIQNLNSSYFNYLKKNQKISTNENMKAVAYMMDTKLWEGFAGEKAEYAIGGPTLEMLLNSYNQKYKNNNQYQVKVSDITGYDISTDGGSTWDYSDFAELNTEDNLYGINSTDKATAMWIASPYSKASVYLMYVNCYGTLGRDSYGHLSIGFRPIVCLKSSVQLKKVESGYEII